MSAKKYFGAFCLYLNYLVHGIGVLVMSLNVHEFEVQWQTDAAGVSVVISSLALKSSKAPTNYFTPNILRKSWSRLVVSVVHLDALAFPVAAT